MRTPRAGQQLRRGVWLAPWIGPDGELVLIALRRDGKLTASGPVTIPAGANHVAFGETLWDELEREDAMPALQVI